MAGEYVRPGRMKERVRRPRSVGNTHGQYLDVQVDGAKILEHLAKGGHFGAACQAAGIRPRTGWLWRRLGRLEVGEHEYTNVVRPEHIAFEQAVEETLAQFEMRILGYWVAEAEHNWQAARDLLARRFPQRWGSGGRRDVQVRSGGDVEIQLVWGDEGEEPHPLSPSPKKLERGNP